MSFAARLLFELLPNATIMSGTFYNKSMKKPALHVWVFDMNAKVHIDITAHQFPIKTNNNILFFRASDSALLEEFGYKLATLAEWNELLEMGPYEHFSLSKINLTYDGKITLNDVYKEIKGKLRQRMSI